MTRRRLEAKVAYERREDRRHFQRREPHADANARPRAEGQIGAAMARLALLGSETVRVEGVWLLPQVLVAMHAPDRDIDRYALGDSVRPKHRALARLASDHR